MYLILHYFVDCELKTEIKLVKSVEEALTRVNELKEEGFHLTEAYYGIYEITPQLVKRIA